ncbi:MAG: hypothetical protein ACE5H6_02035 [Dehalococcoidia bacterium]
MSHLIRAGALILVLGIGFLLVRWIFIPESFGQYGFYRGENVAEWADWPTQYAAVPECGVCHQQRYDTWVNSKHSSVSCENCHGPAQNHAQTGTPLVFDVARELCGLCHAETLAEAAEIIQRQPSALQLRYLQTLVEMAGEKNSTIIPLTVDIVSALSNRLSPGQR